MSLEEFIAIVRDGERKGLIKTYLSDYDLMIQLAIANLGEKKGGYPCKITLDEIFSECSTMGPYAEKLLKQ